jgi:hypothetical protein
MLCGQVRNWQKHAWHYVHADVNVEAHNLRVYLSGNIIKSYDDRYVWSICWYVFAHPFH